jgi:hypothetical protein
MISFNMNPALVLGLRALLTWIVDSVLVCARLGQTTLEVGSREAPCDENNLRSTRFRAGFRLLQRKTSRRS